MPRSVLVRCLLYANLMTNFSDLAKVASEAFDLLKRIELTSSEAPWSFARITGCNTHPALWGALSS